MVTEVVMDSVQSCSRMARHHRVTLNPLIGEADPPRTVTGDCELLRLMLDNLIRNAIRYTPEGSAVIIQVIESQQECTIAVRDFGPALPDELVGSNFEPGALAPNPAGGRGIGLGLSIAQTVAELHSGKITARNTPGRGCEFAAHLPSETPGSSNGT